MLHYFGFTIQLALLHVFNVKMKNLAFDTSKIITTLNVLNILRFCVSGLLGSTLSQKLVVTHAPAYVTFQEQQKPLATGDVSKLISHTLGVPSQSVSIQTPHESVLNHEMLLLISPSGIYHSGSLVCIEKYQQKIITVYSVYSMDLLYCHYCLLTGYAVDRSSSRLYVPETKSQCACNSTYL